MPRSIPKSTLFAGLPPPWPHEMRPAIRAAIAANPEHKLVVLDDDPTGTQTVCDVPVLTTWEMDTLRAEFNGPYPCFYILTNSRSLPPDEARALIGTIAKNLRAVAAGRTFTIVSRSDSTLRGHFPLETDVLADILGPFDATLLIPYFEDGGRYTIDDVHYVADGDSLMPAAETPFARDAAFGYRNSNLRASAPSARRSSWDAASSANDPRPWWWGCRCSGATWPLEISSPAPASTLSRAASTAIPR